MTGNWAPSAAAVGRLCCALDVPDTSAALALAEQVAPHVGVLKVGLELFVREGPKVVEALRPLQRRLFLDLKLHDISETVARAVKSAAHLGVQYLTLHAAGGPRMLQAAQRAADGTDLQLLAVTLLTSLDAEDLRATGVERSSAEHVLGLAQLAQRSGIGGLVCSIAEVPLLRSHLGADLTLVVPGIRPQGAAAFDQKRVGTPGAALQAGASLLVVGRPIRDAAEPAEAARAIALELDAALPQQPSSAGVQS